MVDSADELSRWAWREALRQSDKNERRGYTSPYSHYANDPNAFAREVLGQNFWKAQTAILDSLMKYRKVVVRSCRKSGKTHAAAALVNAFIETAPTVAIITAPGEKQIRENMFQKIRMMHARSKTRLKAEPGVQSLRVEENWFAIGVAASDPENVRGFHAGIDVDENTNWDEDPGTSEEALDVIADAAGRAGKTQRLLIVYDEANGVQPSIHEALRGSLSGDNVYALMLANPMMAADCGHPYANAFLPNSGWFRIHIGCEEPKHDEVESDLCFHDVPRKLAPESWIESYRRDGEETPLFQSDILGCFSTSDLEYQIVPQHVLEVAARWEIYDDDRPTSRHIGCDLAGGETAGADSCVATLWVNGVLSCVHRWKSPDTMHSLDILSRLTVAWGPNGQQIPWSNVHVDATGVGKGVVDRLRQMGRMVDAVNFGAKPRYDWKGLTGDQKFRDRKSELYWVYRRAHQEGLGQTPRKYVDVWRELQWHTHKTIVRSGDTALALVETKEILKDRYGRSPDFADAAVLAWSRGNARPTFRLASYSKFLRA